MRKNFLLGGLLSLSIFTANALQCSQLIKFDNCNDTIKIVSVVPESEKGIKHKKPLLFFDNPVKLQGTYSLSSVLSILGNAGINVKIEDDISNPTLLLNLETASIKEFLDTICKQANIWCSYDPIKREVKIRKYKTFVVEFTPEGKITFSLGGSGGTGGSGSEEGGGSSGSGSGGGSVGGTGQSFSYTVENVSADEIIGAIKQSFPNAKIYPSPTGYIMFVADPRTYREITRFFEERQKRQERVFVEVELIRIDLKREYQWGINWSGLTDIGNIGSLTHLGYSLSFKPIAGGDMGKFVLTTKGGDERALLTMLSKYGKVYKVDSYYAQTFTGTPLPFRNYKLVRYFTISTETDENGEVYPETELNQDEVGFRGVLTIYKREKGKYKYYVDGAVDISAIADWISVNLGKNAEVKAPEIVGQTFKISAPLTNLYSTIIVGGFRSKGINKDTAGNPILMNSPAIGWLFKGKEDMSETSEFIVVIHLKPSAEEWGDKTWLEKAGEKIFNE
jgi:diadenosine tetraphosphate (Ap4A) HIT family hydrolase